MSQSSVSSGRPVLLSIFLGVTTLLSIAFLFYAIVKHNEAERLASELEVVKAGAHQLKVEAEKQKKEAEEHASYCDLRITELEIKYDMCMTKR